MNIQKHLMRFLLVAALVGASLVAEICPIHSSPHAPFSVTNLNDSGDGSLRKAILDANGSPGADTITITANGQLDLESALPLITEAVTIHVPGVNLIRIFKIDGQNAFRGLTIAAVPVTLTGLTVQHCAVFGTLNGGGVVSEGNLTLTNMKFLNNFAGGQGGGASTTASLFVNGSLFEGNRVEDAGGAVSAGGALVVNGSTFRDNRCTAIECTGGGLFAASTLTLTNTQFISNTAQGSGGGLYTMGASHIEGGVFARNLTIRLTGGGLVADGPLVITGTTFISNTAENGGGAVLTTNVAELTNVRFENNHGPDSAGGGGMFAQSTFPTTMNNVDFVGNSGTFGGALRTGGDLFINGGRFENNQSTFGPGGALFANNVVLTDTHFISNTAANTDGAYGGAYVTSIVAVGGGFERNHPGGLTALSSMELTDMQFISNTGTGGASGINVKATRVLFANNSSSIFTAGGLDAGVQTTISDSQFVSNTSTFVTGGVRASGQITISNSHFINNSGRSGGGVRATGDMTITLTEFIGNKAKVGGGLVHEAGNGLLVNTLFARNSATDSGAGLYLAGTGTDTIKHVNIVSPSLGSGTAITTTKEIVLMQNTIVANYEIGLSVLDGFVTLSNDLFHNNGVDIQGSVAVDAERASGDPLFVNAAADNYHLQPESPAIDAGSNAGILSDFDGDVRPALNGFDIGYDEVINEPTGTVTPTPSETPTGSPTPTDSPTPTETPVATGTPHPLHLPTLHRQSTP